MHKISQTTVTYMQIMAGFTISYSNVFGFNAHSSFLWILKIHLRYKGGPYLTQSVYKRRSGVYSLGLLGWVPMPSTELSGQWHLCKWHWVHLNKYQQNVTVKVAETSTVTLSDFWKWHLHKCHPWALSQVISQTDVFRVSKRIGVAQNCFRSLFWSQQPGV